MESIDLQEIIRPSLLCDEFFLRADTIDICVSLHRRPLPVDCVHRWWWQQQQRRRRRRRRGGDEMKYANEIRPVHTLTLSLPSPPTTPPAAIWSAARLSLARSWLGEAAVCTASAAVHTALYTRWQTDYQRIAVCIYTDKCNCVVFVCPGLSASAVVCTEPMYTCAVYGGGTRTGVYRRVH